MKSKFLIGQCVEFWPAGGLAGRYTVVRMMPVEPHNPEPSYRIRGELDGHEWVVTECNLRADVGPVEHYEAIAAELKHLQSQRAPLEEPLSTSIQ